MAPKYLQILTSFDDLAHTTQKMKFSIKDFFITCDQIRRNCGFGHITEEIFNGKLQFLCCVRFHPDIYSPWVYIPRKVTFRVLLIFSKFFVLQLLINLTKTWLS